MKNTIQYNNGLIKSRNFLIVTMLILGLTACVSNSPEKDPTYVSPNHYNDFNCNQLKAEKRRITTKIEQMAELKGNDTTGQVLSTALAAFAISQGYGFNSESDDNTAYKRLYNQYEVLEQTIIQKECF